MSRLLAAILLLVLLVDGLPLVPAAPGACSMPCCKRSAGRAACCPRLAGSAHGLERGSAKGCRLSTCDADSRESASGRFHEPGLVKVSSSRVIMLPREENRAAQECRPRSALPHDPPTPPPRVSLS